MSIEPSASACRYIGVEKPVPSYHTSGSSLPCPCT